MTVYQSKEVTVRNTEGELKNFASIVQDECFEYDDWLMEKEYIFEKEYESLSSMTTSLKNRVQEHNKYCSAGRELTLVRIEYVTKEIICTENVLNFEEKG